MIIMEDIEHLIAAIGGLEVVRRNKKAEVRTIQAKTEEMNVQVGFLAFPDLCQPKGDYSRSEGISKRDDGGLSGE
jgi:hypothetical protein